MVQIIADILYEFFIFYFIFFKSGIELGRYAKFVWCVKKSWVEYYSSISISIILFYYSTEYY